MRRLSAWSCRNASFSGDYLKPPNKKILIVIGLFLIGIMALALAAALTSDFSKLQQVFRHLEIGFFLLSLLTTGLAYLASALSFNALFRMTPYRVPFLKFFSIMFISDTINFIISSAGMSSMANRSILLKHEKVPYSVTVPLSLAQNMVFNLALSCFSFGALVYLHGHPGFVGGPKEGVLLLFMGGLLLVVGLMMLVFFYRDFRRWFLGYLFRVFHSLSRAFLRHKPENKSRDETLDQVESTVALLQKGWIRLMSVFVFVALNWCLMALTFYLCFHAVGLDLPLGLLLVGFTVMYLSSNINPVPAGLGVSESLLALTFKMLGVAFEPTLVAALLFRLVYYLIPLAISTILYLDTIRKILGSQEGEGSL